MWSKFTDSAGDKLAEQWVAMVLTPAFIFWAGGIAVGLLHTDKSWWACGIATLIPAHDVAGWAGLWLRVDESDRGTGGQPLSFDNMGKRPITGSSDWTRHEIVLDVPANAGAIAFGILLHGTGAIWLDDVTFATVGADVPTTG